MALARKAQFQFMKDLGAPALMTMQKGIKKKRPHRPNPHFGPPLKSAARLKEIMTRHYLLARYAPGAMPVA